MGKKESAVKSRNRKYRKSTQVSNGKKTTVVYIKKRTHRKHIQILSKEVHRERFQQALGILQHHLPLGMMIYLGFPLCSSLAEDYLETSMAK